LRRGNVWAWWPAVTAAAIATAFSLAVILVPTVPFGYRHPDVHLAIETALSMLAVAVAVLAFGRIRQHGQTTDLILVVALLTLGGAALLFAAMPAMGFGPPPPFPTWASLAGGLAGASLLATAAFMRARQLARRDGPVLAVAFAAALLAVIYAVAAWVAPTLPAGVREVTALMEGRPALVDHRAVTGLQALAGVLYITAAAGFTLQAGQRRDDLMRWLAAACVFGAFAKVHYVLYPSAYSDWVSTGDVLRGGFFGLLAFAGTRELRSYWEALADVAVLEERHRIARDLHDGLSQELAYIHGQARRLNEISGESLRQPLAASAQRALDESRHAIAALTRPLDETLDVAIAQAAEEVADRTDTPVHFDLAADVKVPPDTREELVRIVREAVSNAGRHASAERVSVHLSNGDGILVIVEDDGVGFDTTAAPRAGHYGILSMQERTTRLQGQLLLESAPGKGTRVEVRVP
jgi:signal transduction histidine kinase